MTYKRLPKEFGEPDKVRTLVRQFMSPAREFLSGKSGPFNLGEIARRLYEGNYTALKDSESLAKKVICLRFVERVSTEGSGPTLSGGGTFYFYPHRREQGRYILCEDNFL